MTSLTYDKTSPRPATSQRAGPKLDFNVSWTTFRSQLKPLSFSHLKMSFNSMTSLMSTSHTSVPQDHIASASSNPSPPNAVPKRSSKTTGSSIPAPTANTTVRPIPPAIDEVVDTHPDEVTSLMQAVQETHTMYRRFNQMVDSLTTLQANLPGLIGDAIHKAISIQTSELTRSADEIIQTLKSRRRSESSSDDDAPLKKIKIDEAAAAEAVRIEAERVEEKAKHERQLLAAKKKAENQARIAQQLEMQRIRLEAELAAEEIQAMSNMPSV